MGLARSHRGVTALLWSLDTPEQIEWGLAKKPYGLISNEMVLAKQLRDAQPQATAPKATRSATT